MTEAPPLIRRATPQDALLLAQLVDAAGEGIPTLLWSAAAEPGETPLEVGAKRAARSSGAFSFSNAWIAEVGGMPLGMLLGYRQPDPYDAGVVDDLPAVVRPLVELEALCPGSWYVNAVAVLPESRGRGIGSLLMRQATECAAAAGCRQLSLIVAEENHGAVALYRRLGYREVARRPVHRFAAFPHGGDWLLMTR